MLNESQAWLILMIAAQSVSRIQAQALARLPGGQCCSGRGLPLEKDCSAAECCSLDKHIPGL